MNNLNNNKMMTNKMMTNIDLNKSSKTLPFSFWIKSILSFRFISNLTIIVSIIAYYMNAYEVFFIVSPLMIVNFILITYILFTHLDDFMKTILEDDLPDKKERDTYKLQFVVLVILWHILPLFWLFYSLEKNNLVTYFRPNFMGIYLKSILIPILYYYYESNEKIYGDLNYPMFFVFYILLLLGVCIYLYLA